MEFHPDSFYHIYNRGNNKQQIFFSFENYLFFLKKIKHHLLPHCDILNHCLMPNHFHILIYTKSHISGPDVNNSIAIILRSYAQAINKLYSRTGSLFQQKTKAKLLCKQETHYPFICFNYIHQNPLKAKLVTKMEDWEFSSFRDYIGLRNGTLVNKTLACLLLDLPADKEELYFLSYKVINDDLVNDLFD